MILYALYVDAIFFPCHPYIWSTTVLHDIQVGSSYKSFGIPLRHSACKLGLIMWEASAEQIDSLPFIIVLENHSPAGVLSIVSQGQTLDGKVRVWGNAHYEFVDFAS